MTSISLQKSEFVRLIKMQILIIFNCIPNGYSVVRHMKDSSKLSIGKYKSWSECYREEFNMNVGYEDNICPCCQREIIEDKHNYFIIGHVIPIESPDKICLLPVCNECNVKLKHYRFLAPESKLKEMPKFK